MDTQHEIIIVGAGVVGSALGYALGNAGKKVLVIERDWSEPDRIVGELMQPGGVQKLRELGLEGCLQEIDASEVFGYGVFLDGKGLKLPYPKVASDKLGRSFHHGRFIMGLRGALKRAQNTELRQGTVTSLLQEGAQVIGVTYKDAENREHELRAPLTIVCDGCNSNFRKEFFAEKPVATSSFVGLIINDVELPYFRHGHVFLIRPGPCLAYKIGSTESRMLIDIPLPLPSSTNGDLQRFLLEVTAPQLPESIRPAFIHAVQTQKLRSMPSLRLHPQPSSVKPGVLLLGDAWNMRHPLTGGGMSVGLADAVIVRDILTEVGDLSDPVRTQKALEQLHVRRKPLASTVNVLAGALYSVFAASDDPVLPLMRRACLTYFRMGSLPRSGTVSLLSILSPHPTALAFHFFAVAFVGVMQVLWPFPTWGRIKKAHALLSAASAIIVPLLKAENVLPFIPVICRMLLLTKNTRATKIEQV